MPTHYLKVKLFFNPNDELIRYQIVDGGYDPPPEPYRAKTHCREGHSVRAFIVHVVDEGKSFDKYAEYALNVFHEWKAKGNFMFGRLDHKRDPKYGNHDGELL